MINVALPAVTIDFSDKHDTLLERRSHRRSLEINPGLREMDFNALLTHGKGYLMQLAKISGMLVVALMLAGCASGELERLRTEWRTSQEQIAQLKRQLVEKDEQISAIQAEQAGKPDLTGKLSELIAERDRMKNALAEAEKRIREAGDVGPSILPEKLDKALMALAEANPELMSYDPQRGMVKFRSDFTFSLGSTAVKAAAADSLNKLAKIISTPVAGRYEVVIVGHTDNVPIKRVKSLHPTNWHLSVHRAISVKDVLSKSGVSAERLAVKGYGEYRPVVANGAKGSAANRRVEIFLVPSTATGLQPAPAAVEPGPRAEAKKNDSSFK